MPVNPELKSLYGDCEGPLGFQMRTEQAKAVEDALKAQSQDAKDAAKLINGEDSELPDGLARVGVAPKIAIHGKTDDDKLNEWGIKAGELKEGEAAEISVITTNAIDRDREVILPQGLKFTLFDKNPIVPWGHNYSILPVGKSPYRSKTMNEDRKHVGWRAKTIYSQKNPFAVTVWEMTLEGMLCAKSIGFIPMEVRQPTPEDIKARPDLADCRFMITKGEVLEYSVVSIGANPFALIESVQAKGLFMPKLVLEEMGVYLHESDMSDFDAEIERIRKSAQPGTSTESAEPITLAANGEPATSTENTATATLDIAGKGQDGESPESGAASDSAPDLPDIPPMKTVSAAERGEELYAACAKKLGTLNSDAIAEQAHDYVTGAV